jgi:hypothetical protein
MLCHLSMLYCWYVLWNVALITSHVLVANRYFWLLAVSKNPNRECNPQLGEDNIIGIVLGVGLTTISLAWTGWSYTAEAKINGSK